VATNIKSCGWCGHLLEENADICPVCSVKYISDKALKESFHTKIWKGYSGVLLFLIPIWASFIFLLLAEIEKRLMHSGFLASLSLFALFIIPAVGIYPIFYVTNISLVRKLFIALLYYFVSLIIVLIIGTWAVFSLQVFTR